VGFDVLDVRPSARSQLMVNASCRRVKRARSAGVGGAVDHVGRSGAVTSFSIPACARR
jgi:hypothetical protein